MVAVTLPTITSKAAFRRAEEFVAVTFAVPFIVKVPVSASMLMVPGAAVVTSTFAVNSTSLPPLIVMWPLPERMSAFAVMLPARASIRMLPLPFAVTLMPSASTPSFRVMLPALANRTILPLLPVARSD